MPIQQQDFIVFGYKFNGKITGSYGGSIFSLLRDTVFFPGGCPDLYLHQQFVHILSSCHQQDLAFVFLLIV